MASLNQVREPESHPAEELLRQFALGKSPSETAKSVAAHLEMCSACGSSFDSFDLSADPLVAHLQRAADKSVAESSNPAPTASLDTEDLAPQALLDTGPHFRIDSSPASRVSVLPGSETAAVGQTIGGFRLLGVLGEGGFGTVYRAEDRQLRRKVALKVLQPRALERPDAQDRFLAEAQALAAIHHDHVVPIYSVGNDNGQLFIAMPLLAGESLASRLEREGALPADEVRRIGRETAAGLSAIHAKGLVHRDLKPANIWLEAGSNRVKVLDLGLAQDPLQVKQELTGTPLYMSPEQTTGSPVDCRADLFSLGAVLYECATGRRAFAGNSRAEVLTSVREQVPTDVLRINPSVPADLCSSIAHLLEKDPQKRPVSAAEVAAKFTSPVTSPGSTAKRTASAPLFLTIGVSSLVVALATAAYVVTRQETPDPQQPTVPSPAVPLVEPVRVESFQVNHFATIDGDNVRPRGVLGQQSFGAALGDEFNVQAKLSRPAYSYLIVYRPDGQSEVLYPQDDTDVPELTDTPHYPSKRPDERYVLEEGAGLWLVTLFVSESPLPSYREWQALHPDTPWKPSPGQPGTVWWDDGQLFHTLESGNDVRGSKKTADLEPIAQLIDWLRDQGRGATQAIGFTVK